MGKNEDLEKLMQGIRRSQSKKLPNPKEILDKASENHYKKDKKLPDPGKLIDEIRKSQSRGYSGQGNSIIPPSDITPGSIVHTPNSSSLINSTNGFTFSQNTLKTIVMPLPHNTLYVYIANLEKIVVNNLRDSIDSLFVYTSHGLEDRTMLCTEISQALERKKQEFPTDLKYDKSLYKKNMAKGWASILTVLVPEGKDPVTKTIKYVPIATGVAGAMIGYNLEEQLGIYNY